METKAVVYKAQFGPRFRMCRDCFDSMSDGRSYERYEVAGKTALRWDVSSCTTKIVFVFSYQMDACQGQWGPTNIDVADWTV